jgi:16S rRNA (cytosine967-C5)-methyltransferase
LAIQVLSRTALTDAYLNVVLDTLLSERSLEDPRDSALVTELSYGVARRQLALDFALSTVSDRRLETLEARVLAALRVGAYQIFYMRVPRHAAVAETVEALKALGVDRAAGFANAVLRRLAGMETLPLPPEAPAETHLAVRESHPEWLVRRWLRQFGAERAEQMLVADNVAPPVTVRVNRARTSRDALVNELRTAGLDVQPTKYSPVGVVLPSAGKVEDVWGYTEGLWQVQDEAAQLVAVYGAIPEGARVLDACAAPGGKACQMAERCEVVASDLHSAKLRKIETEAHRLGVLERMTLRTHDATTPFPDDWGDFDAIVVDAPCTGLGTLRRHPELRYRRKEEDIARLAALQTRILENAQEKVRPGGLLVYSVCSTEPREGADVIEMFLRSHPDFTAEAPNLEGSPLPSWQGHLRTLPGPEHLDGFFAARLRRLS